MLHMLLWMWKKSQSCLHCGMRRQSRGRVYKKQKPGMTGNVSACQCASKPLWKSAFSSILLWNDLSAWVPHVSSQITASMSAASSPSVNPSIPTEYFFLTLFCSPISKNLALSSRASLPSEHCLPPCVSLCLQSQCWQVTMLTPSESAWGDTIKYPGPDTVNNNLCQRSCDSVSVSA